MPRLGTSLRQLFPPTPLSRRLATQSLLFATAEGTFLTGMAERFLEREGITPGGDAADPDDAELEPAPSLT